MKQKLFLLVFLTTAFIASAQNYDFSAVAPSGQTLYYKIVNGHAEVARPTANGDDTQGVAGLTGDIIIPETVVHNGQTYTVTGFYTHHNFYGAFSYCYNLRSVTMPNTITSIGSYTFSYCDNLESVVISNSVTTIGAWAFYGCGKLDTITIPNSVTSIGDYAFNSCSLISMTVPSSVVTMGVNVFSSNIGGCGVSINGLRMLYYDGPATGSPWGARCVNGYEEDSLFYTSSNKRVLVCGHPKIVVAHIPNTVTQIRNAAFLECTELQSVTMGNSVTTIGDCAFNMGNHLIDSLTVPNSVTSIGNNAFSSVKMLFYNGSGSYGAWYKNGFCEDSIFYSSPQKNTVVGAHHLISVANIPNSVTQISSNAFRDCKRLYSVTIPSSVSGIGERAFSGCDKLESITIPNGVTSIQRWTFAGCTSLTSVTIPNTTTSIQYGAFETCSNLRNVALPSTLTSIAGNAFLDCIRIDSLIVPSLVDVIGDNAFNNINLVKYDGDAMGNPWGAKCVNGFYEDSLYYSNSLKRVLTGACVDIVYANIPSTVISIKKDAFYHYAKLTSLIIPNTVTSIGGRAFEECVALSSLLIPTSVISIGEGAFAHCGHISKLSIHCSVSSIHNVFVDTYADTLVYNIDSIGDFSYSSTTGDRIPVDSIKVAYVGGNVRYWPNNLLSGCAQLLKVVVCDSVTNVGSAAFQNCTSLALVELPNSLTNIGSSAFQGCTSLASVEIPNSVTNIGNYAFQGCTSLASVEIPNSVTNIGNNMLKNCVNLSSVSIGRRVNSIGRYSFEGCFSLDTLYFNADSMVDYTASNRPLGFDSLRVVIMGDSVQRIPVYLFREKQRLEHVRIGGAVETISSYAFYGCTSLNSVEFPNSVIDIGSYAFQNCASLDTVEFPNSMTNIGNYAFSGCSGLASVEIPTSVTTIGNGAFYNCNSLDSVVIPNSVNSIGSSTFSGCTNLASITLSDALTSIPSNLFSNCSSLADVWMGSPNPPSLASNAFNGTPSSKIIHVLCGSQPAYTSQWGGNYNYHSHLCDLNVFTSDSVRGTAGVAAALTWDGTVVVSAQNNYGYHFDHWSNNSVANPDTLRLGTFDSITAFFEKNSYVITVLTVNSVMGDVSGSDTALYLDSLTISATPNYGYHFVRWNDNNTDNPRIVQVTRNKTYTAQFTYNQYAITLDVDTSIHGTISGAGNYNYLSNRTIRANPSYGYHFTMWSDSVTDNPRTLTLTQDTAFTALFDRNTYTITVLSNNDVMGDVAGTDSALYLDSLTISALSNYGYHFVRWDDNNTDNPRTVQVTQNETYTAIFTYNQYTITLGADNNIHGTVSGDGNYNYLSSRTITATPNYGYHFTAWSDGVTDNPRTLTLTQDTSFTALFDRNTYTITVLSNNDVMGDVAGSDSALYLDSLNISATSNYGYHFVQWNDNNIDNPRTVQVTQNEIYTAIFTYNQYTITLGADNIVHGTVSGDGIYNYLSSRTITATPNYGYHFTAWSDGVTDNPRTLTLTQDTFFTALFAKNQYNLQAYSNDGSIGTVTGGGTYEYLDVVTLTATCTAAHHHFVQWTDGMISPVRTVMLTQDTSFVALFAIDTHYVACEASNGYIVGAGDYPYGTTVTVAAIANEGFHFGEWESGSRSNTEYFILTGDTTVWAVFTPDAHPEICMVSVQGGRNVLMWNKEDIPLAEYNIYREGVTSGDYDLVATISYDSLSIWMDEESRPMTHSYRYKISATDIYDIESEESEIHKTMHLTISQGVGNSWNLVWTPYEGATYSSYQIYRGSDANNVELIDQFSSNGNTTYTDYDVNIPTVYYQVAILKDEPCYITKANNLIKSNIATNGTIGVGNVQMEGISLYSLDGNIVVEGAEGKTVQVFDAVGRKVATMAVAGESVSMAVPAGVYLVKIGDFPTQKVVVIR